MFSRPKTLFLVSLLFVALLNSIPTYFLNFEFFIILIPTWEHYNVRVIYIVLLKYQHENYINANMGIIFHFYIFI